VPGAGKSPGLTSKLPLWNTAASGLAEPLRSVAPRRLGARPIRKTDNGSVTCRHSVSVRRSAREPATFYAQIAAMIV